MVMFFLVIEAEVSPKGRVLFLKAETPTFFPTKISVVMVAVIQSPSGKNTQKCHLAA